MSGNAEFAAVREDVRRDDAAFEQSVGAPSEIQEAVAEQLHGPHGGTLCKHVVLPLGLRFVPTPSAAATARAADLC